jgi:hypothetical protein
MGVKGGELRGEEDDLEEVEKAILYADAMLRSLN